MKYIGIIGNRGSGRETFAWLLGKTLQHQAWSGFDSYPVKFDKWVEEVKKSKSCIGGGYLYVLESFGGIITDNIKLMVPTLRELDLSQGSKDLDRKFDMETLTLDSGENTIRDFIVQYADAAIKRNFGQNFWVLIAEQWAKIKEQDNYSSEEYIFYWDVKTDEEAAYIHRHNGVLIELSCPERYRKGGYKKIKNTKPDIYVELHKDFVNDCEKIWNLAHSLSSSD